MRGGERNKNNVSKEKRRGLLSLTYGLQVSVGQQPYIGMITVTQISDPIILPTPSANKEDVWLFCFLVLPEKPPKLS